MPNAVEGVGYTQADPNQNPLQQLGQITEIQNRINQNQQFQREFNAQQMLGEISKRSLDPNTGQIDTAKMLATVAANPGVSWKLPEIAQQLYAVDKAKAESVQAQANAKAEKAAFRARLLGPIVNRDLTKEPITKKDLGNIYAQARESGLWNPQEILSFYIDADKAGNFSASEDKRTDQERQNGAKYLDYVYQSGLKQAEWNSTVGRTMSQVSQGSNTALVGSNVRGVSSMGNVPMGMTPSERAVPTESINRETLEKETRPRFQTPGMEGGTGQPGPLQPANMFGPQAQAPQGQNPLQQAAPPMQAPPPAPMLKASPAPNPIPSPTPSPVPATAVNPKLPPPTPRDLQTATKPIPDSILTGLNPAASKNLTDRAEAAAKMENALNETVQLTNSNVLNLQNIEKLLAGTNTGGGTEFRTRLASASNLVTGLMPWLNQQQQREISDWVAGGNLANNEVIIKQAMVNATGALRQALGTSSKYNLQEFEAFMQANPTVNTDPRAIREMIRYSKFVASILNAEQAEYMKWIKPYQSGGRPKNDPADFPAHWQQILVKRGIIQFGDAIPEHNPGLGRGGH